MRRPNANGFASQWNVGFIVLSCMVPECCVIKLTCTVRENSTSSLGHGWIGL